MICILGLRTYLEAFLLRKSPRGLDWESPLSTELKDKTRSEFIGTACDVSLVRDAYARVLHSGANAVNEPRFHTGDTRWTVFYSSFRDSFDTARSNETLDTVLTTAYIAKAERRLAALSTYEEDWDGEGAAAPIASSIKDASNFLKRLEPWHPRPVATLNDEGYAVLEFYDDGSNDFWGSITFLEDGQVYAYASGDGSIEGHVNDREVLRLLSNGLQITLKP